MQCVADLGIAGDEADASAVRDVEAVVQHQLALAERQCLAPALDGGQGCRARPPRPGLLRRLASEVAPARATRRAAAGAPGGGLEGGPPAGRRHGDVWRAAEALIALGSNEHGEPAERVPDADVSALCSAVGLGTAGGTVGTPSGAAGLSTPSAAAGAGFSGATAAVLVHERQRRANAAADAPWEGHVEGGDGSGAGRAARTEAAAVAGIDPRGGLRDVAAFHAKLAACGIMAEAVGPRAMGILERMLNGTAPAGGETAACTRPTDAEGGRGPAARGEGLGRVRSSASDLMLLHNRNRDRWSCCPWPSL